MSEQNMDPKKRNIIIGCSVAGAVVVIAAIIAVIFTTGALNKIGIGAVLPILFLILIRNVFLRVSLLRESIYPV